MKVPPFALAIGDKETPSALVAQGKMILYFLSQILKILVFEILDLPIAT
jgi:hypothetical protein